jgi:tetratricopeptide (TPR) repeat protein
MADAPYSNKRTFTRRRLAKDFDLIIQGKSIHAIITDISPGGIGVILKDVINLESPLVDIKISEEDIDIKGKAVWVRRTPAGLKLGIHTSGPVKGKLSYFGVPNLLMGLHRMGKTGILEIDAGGPTKKICFLDGELVLSAADRDAWGMITDMLNLDYGDFAFREGPLTAEGMMEYRLNIGDLIYQGTKKTENAEQIKKCCPPMDSVLYLPADTEKLLQKIKIDEDGMSILSLIDGKHTLQDIVSLSSSGELDAMRTVCALSRVQVIDVAVDVSASEAAEADEQKEDAGPDSETAAKIEQLYSVYKSLGYHGILGVGRNASLTEIKQAYHKMAKEFHPDRYVHFSSDSLKAKINDLFIYLNEAYRELSKTPQGVQHSSVEEKGPLRADDNTKLARQRFRDGKDFLDRGRYEQALPLFGQAVYLDKSVAEYHFYYGIALLRNKKVKPAEESIKTALQLDQYNSEYLTELGYIYLHLGFKTRAKNTLEKALKYDPSNMRAEEGIKEADG